MLERYPHLCRAPELLLAAISLTNPNMRTLRTGLECYDVLLLSSTLKLRGQGRNCMILDAFFRRQVSGAIAPLGRLLWEHCSLDKCSSSRTYKVSNSETDIHTALPGTDDNLVQSGCSTINVDGDTTMQQRQSRNPTDL